MNRRELLSFLGVITVIGLPTSADEASGKPFRIGYVLFGMAGPKSSSTVAFEQRFRELGYIEGKTLVIEFRWLEGKIERYPEVMEELVRHKIDVIVTTGQEAAVKAAKQATATTPIVMQAVDFDPVALGYVSSLPRPGGSITGIFLQQTELTGKRLELLKEAVPEIGRVIILWDQISGDQIATTVRAAQSLQLQVKSVELRDPPYDYATALEAINPQPNDALLLLTSPIFNSDRVRLAEVALRTRLPSMFANRQYTDAGGLISYTPNYPAMYRLTAEYVDKILRGAKPADLPIQQPTKFELVINLRTAKALGLSVPQSLLQRADEVIE